MLLWPSPPRCECLQQPQVGIGSKFVLRNYEALCRHIFVLSLLQDFRHQWRKDFRHFCTVWDVNKNSGILLYTDLDVDSKRLQSYLFKVQLILIALTGNLLLQFARRFRAQKYYCTGLLQKISLWPCSIHHEPTRPVRSTRV